MISGPEHAQIYAEVIGSGGDAMPLVFVHGGHHTGTCWMRTPDGRIGWAPYMAERGHPGYVIDWPGRGGSPERDLAGLSLSDVADGVAALLADVGPAVLVTHSMGGMLGWRAAELARNNLLGIVAIAPGPPANLQPPLAASEIVALQHDPGYATSGKPTVVVQPSVFVTADVARAVWANTERFPNDAFAAYFAALVPESGRALNERNNIDGIGIRVTGPEAFAGIPTVVITGDSDTRHPREVDTKIADYFGSEFIWLADLGITGRGHMLMIEHGNLDVADVVLQWISANVRAQPSPPASAW